MVPLLLLNIDIPDLLTCVHSLILIDTNYGCTPQLKFDTATSITTKGRIPISGLKAAYGKGKFQPDNRNGCEKYNDSDDDEWFLGFDEKGKDMHMKHCKVLLEPIVERKHKKNGMKTVVSQSSACGNGRRKRF